MRCLPGDPLVGGVSGSGHHDENRGRRRPADVILQDTPDLGVPTPLLDPAHHGDAPLGQHGHGLEQSVQAFAGEVARAADVDVEIPESRIDGGVDDGADEFFLEKVFLTGEVIDPCEGAALNRLACRRIVNRRHTGRKLPTLRL